MGEWWVANWFNVVTGILGLIGIPGLVIGWKSWKKKQPVYLIRSINLFSDIDTIVPDVVVKFAEYTEQIKVLTITKIALWNGGNETIRHKEDMVKNDLLSIKAAEGVVILSASVIQFTSEHNKFNITMNEGHNRATIWFDYMDQNQGVVIQLFHTGTGSKDLTIEGTFKGVKAITRRVLYPQQSKPQLKRQPRISLLVTLSWLGALWVLVIVITLAAFQPPSDPAPRPASDPVLRSPVVALLLCGLLSLATLLIIYVAYITTVPRSLSKFNSDR